jgi:hypothetical protein
MTPPKSPCAKLNAPVSRAIDAKHQKDFFLWRITTRQLFATLKSVATKAVINRATHICTA